MKKPITAIFLLVLSFQWAFAFNVHDESVCHFTVTESPTTILEEEILAGEIVINEILPGGTVELKNIGDETVDISGYWLCNFPSYSQLSNLNFLCGGTMVAAGEIVAIDGFNNLNPIDGELGLYQDNNFGSSTSILDYVEWGSGGHQREPVAVAAGIWIVGDFTPFITPGSSLSFDGEGNTSADFVITAGTSICDENFPSSVDGGEIAIANGGGTSITICAGDGNSDAFGVDLTGNEGPNSAWVITDDAGNILALPAGPPFDLEGAGGGVCLVWHLSFEDGLMGAEVGMNANDLEGVFDLSNSIMVIRNGVDGGELAIEGGGTELTICAGDGISDAFNVELTGNTGVNSAWVITDDAGNILALPAAPPFDLEGAGGGVCLVWYLSYEDGLVGAEVGQNTADLEGCFDFSNPITVTRNGVDGGDLAIEGGGTELTICAGDGISDEFDVELTGNEGTNSAWVITDDAGNILALPPFPPFDLEGAGEGVCLVWHLSFEDGLTGAEVGQNAADLGGCFDLSNPITVTRNGVSGGDLAIAGGGTELTICAGDGISDEFDVELTGNEGENSAWVITDDAGNILALPAAPPFDLEGAGGGVCLIWHLSFADGLMGAEVGQNAAALMGCYDLSNPITVTRNGVNGGEIIMANGFTNFTICAGDGISDEFDVDLTGAEGANSAWVITDDAGNILALPAAPPFDLEGAGEGVCLVWHLSFEDGLMGAEVGQNAADLEGCFDLSNPITITRVVDAACDDICNAEGGDLTTVDGLTELTICAGDGVSDAFDVILTGNAGQNSAWVITDDAGNILALPAAPPFDLEGAGGGVCLIWHLTFDDGIVGAEVGLNANDLEGCFDLSNPITVTRNGVNGGNLFLAGGGTELTICAGDGVSDEFDVELVGAEGANSAWVITDDLGNILALPAAPPFDLEGAGGGVCLVWHLSFADGLTGAEVGQNAADLEGCFNLSNPITVTRNGVEGGDLAIAGGGTELTICAGDGVSDAFDVELVGNEGANSAWVITDDLGNILALPAAPPFDLEGAGGGVCLVWHLSFEDGLVGAEVGLNANDLEGCFNLSNPITVTRNGVNGGELAIAGGGTELTICAGDGISDAFDVELAGNEGANSAWVITDDLGNILALPAAPPFDLEGAGGGTCLVWHLSFADGLTGAEVGQNANDLEGCFNLSNPITVIRNGVDAGTVTTVDNETEIEICVGDGVADVIAFANTSTEGEFQYVVTDDNNTILGLPADNMVDFEGAGFGTCRVWGLSYTGNLTAELGDDAAAVDLSDECFVLSDEFVTVVRDTTGDNCVTSTFEINPDDIQISLQPNPVNSNLLVKISFEDFTSEELNVEIFSSVGQLMEANQFQTGLQIDLNIDVQEYPAGMYLMKATNGNRIITQRFVKE